jgi:hypothetical protein
MGVAQAATYYVATTGSDTNPGSQIAPFRHLSKAAATAKLPGDTVIVADGTYDNEGVTAPNFVVNLYYPGAAGQPITFMAQNRGKAILDSMNTSTSTACNGASAYFNLANASFLVLQGFVMQRGCDSGIQSNGTAHDITIRWNEIRNIANHTVTDQIGRDGIYLNTSEYNFVFDGNVFHDIGRTDGQSLLHFDHGIYSHGQNMTIVNNIFYNMNRGWSIQLADGAANWLVANNTFAFGNANGEAGQIMFWGGNTNIDVVNNIFYAPNASAMNQYAATITGGAFNHNMVSGAGSIIAGILGLLLGANQLGINPMFVNASSAPYDFHLLPGSPAIAAGVNLPADPIDITGASRPAGATTDLGVYETGGAIPPPPPPPPGSSFSMSASMAAGAVAQNNSGTDVITATLLAGSPVAVSFTVSGQPAGVTATLSAASCTATCSTNLTVAVSSAGAPGTYKLVVNGIGGGTSASTTIALTVTGSGGTGTGGDITTGLVARWKLNEMAGTVANDSSGLGNTGAIHNGYWWTSVHGPCLWLNGPGDYISVAEKASLEMTNALTVAFWLDPNANSNLDPRVVAKLYDWDVKLSGANRYPQFTAAAGQYAILNYSLPLNTWHHLTFTFANGVVKGYVDGVAAPFLQNTFNGTGTLAPWAYGLFLGTDASQTNSLIGSLADIRLFNRALTAADVAALYASK